MYQGKKVLVTGGTGMIGIQLVRLLLQRGASVRIASLDDKTPFGNDVEFLQGNLMEWAFCRKAVSGMEYVFHLAGIKGSVGIGTTKAASFFVPHLLMNTLMMEAARTVCVERYLYTSSIAVYCPSDLFVEHRAWDGPPHYTDRFAAWAKRMGELQAEAYELEYGWEKIAIVRPANVYGPHDNFDPNTAMVVPSLISRICSGQNPLLVWGDGSAIRDLIFSRDCAEGMLLALEKGANCMPINLGSGKGTSIRELIATILACFDNPPQVFWDTTKPSGQAVRLMDITRAKETLGFTPVTSLADGIRETVEWYKENHELVSGRYNLFYERAFLEG